MATTGKLAATAALVLLSLALLAACQGPAGPRGPAGEPGPPGETGPEGPPGENVSPAAGAMCETGSVVVGFDAEGGIICAPLALPTPIPAGELSADAGDDSPPSLAAFDFQPRTISMAEGPGQVTFTARILDDLSGNVLEPANKGDDPFTSLDETTSQVRFRNGGQFFDALFFGPQLVSGDARDGLYEFTQTIQPHHRRGTWELEWFLLVDQAGNSQRLSPDDLREQGMPTSLVIE